MEKTQCRPIQFKLFWAYKLVAVRVFPTGNVVPSTAPLWDLDQPETHLYSFSWNDQAGPSISNPWFVVGPSPSLIRPTNGNTHRILIGSKAWFQLSLWNWWNRIRLLYLFLILLDHERIDTLTDFYFYFLFFFKKTRWFSLFCCPSVWIKVFAGQVSSWKCCREEKKREKSYESATIVC